MNTITRFSYWKVIRARNGNLANELHCSLKYCDFSAFLCIKITASNVNILGGISIICSQGEVLFALFYSLFVWHSIFLFQFLFQCTLVTPLTLIPWVGSTVQIFVYNFLSIDLHWEILAWQFDSRDLWRVIIYHGNHQNRCIFCVGLLSPRDKNDNKT